MYEYVCTKAVCCVFTKQIKENKWVLIKDGEKGPKKKEEKVGNTEASKLVYEQCYKEEAGQSLWPFVNVRSGYSSSNG